MMHQNLSFTGIHWVEHKDSQWIHDWQVCPLHLQQWMTVSRYFLYLFFLSFYLFFWLFLFKSRRLAAYVRLSICSQTPRQSDSDILPRRCCEDLLIFVLRARYKDYKQTICFWIGLLLYCCKQSAQVSHIQYAYAIFRVISLIIIIVVIIIIIMIRDNPVINFTFIHKSWQQIRRGDAHDGRSQNWKAVQKNEVVFTVRMCVCLPYCQSAL